MSATVLCFGEFCCGCRRPTKELLLQSPRFDAHVGGAEANVAVSLSKLGHAAAMVEHAAGIAARARVRRRVAPSRRATDAIRFRDGRMGMYFLTHGAGHRPAEVLYDRAGFRVRQRAGRRLRLERAARRLQRGCTFPASRPLSAMPPAKPRCDAMTAARQRGVKISFDCNFRARVWGARAQRSACSAAQAVRTGRPDLRRRARLRVHARLRGIAPRTSRPPTRFEAFQHLQYIACTERARHSVGRAAARGLVCRAGRTPTRRRPYPLLRHRRSHRRGRCVRRRRSARPDQQFRSAEDDRLRDRGGRA